MLETGRSPMPHGTMCSKCVRSGETLRARPCIVTWSGSGIGLGLGLGLEQGLGLRLGRGRGRGRGLGLGLG